MMRRVLLLVAVACAVACTEAGATDLRHLLGRGPMAAAGSLTVPAAWAGIWDYEDSTRTCGQPGTEPPTPGVDTLCTGDYVGPESGGLFTWDCTGNIDDTSANISCTASYELYTGCTANFTFTIDAARTGDTYVSTTTFTTSYSPSFCAFQQDSCMETISHATRIAGPPAECASPVQPLTWGAMKALYR